MGKTVFILGAGASVEAGAPVMSDFLDVAEELLATGCAGNEEGFFRAVFDGLHALQAVFAKSQIDTNNLEAVFVAFEMASLLDCLPTLSSHSLPHLPTAMTRLIVKTIEQTMIFPVASET